MAEQYLDRQFRVELDAGMRFAHPAYHALDAPAGAELDAQRLAGDERFARLDAHAGAGDVAHLAHLRHAPADHLGQHEHGDVTIGTAAIVGGGIVAAGDIGIRIGHRPGKGVAIHHAVAHLNSSKAAAKIISHSNAAIGTVASIPSAGPSARRGACKIIAC
nr:hypothetical protein [Sphingomonas bacterium]